MNIDIDFSSICEKMQCEHEDVMRAWLVVKELIEGGVFPALYGIELLCLYICAYKKGSKSTYYDPSVSGSYMVANGIGITWSTAGAPMGKPVVEIDDNKISAGIKTVSINEFAEDYDDEEDEE